MSEIVSGMQRIWYDNIPHTIFADIDKYQIEDIHICLLLAIIVSRRPLWKCSRNVVISASKSSIRRFVIMEKAPTRTFSWLQAATTAFTFKTVLNRS